MANSSWRSAAVNTNGEDTTSNLRLGTAECEEIRDRDSHANNELVAMMTQMQRTYSGTRRSHFLSRSNIDLSREKPVSRLVIMQARFQQRQLQEKEEKLLRMYEEQQDRQERALQRVKGLGGQVTKGGAGAGNPVGAGKVRSLLQYRRDHGRDKSYPLDPLPRSQTQPTSPPNQIPTRTKSLDTRKPQRHIQRPSRQNVLYFGGSQQDLRFSDELDYGQSFQVIDDQLLYDAPPRTDSDDTDDDFYIKSFNNKRQFYETRFSGVSEENLSEPYEPKTFQKLPNVGLSGSIKMNQKKETPPSKYKTFVSGKSTIGAAQPRSGLPTRQAMPPSGLPQKRVTSPPAKKPAALPPARPRLGLDSPPLRSPPEAHLIGLKNLQLNSPPSGHLNGSTPNGNSTPPRLNGAGSPPPKQINSSATKKPLSPPHRTLKSDNTSPSVVPPVPASRTTVPRPSSANTSSTASPTRKPMASRSSSTAGLAPCRHCGRNFAPDRVAKHETICKNSTIKKRKVFDPVKHRVQGTEAEKYVLSGISTKNAQKAEKVIKSKSNWRRKHEEFISSIRAAKEVQDHLKKGGKLSDLPPPPPSDYSDYVQCPHCQRKFNETAADRHIPKCATMLHNKSQPVRRPAPPVRSSSTFRKK